MRGRFSSKTRLVVLCVLAGMLAVTCVANALHLRSLERQLSGLGAEHTAGLLRDGLILAGEDSVAEAIASKRYVLFGPTSGKVTVYLRSYSEAGNARYRMLAIFYERTGTEWIQTESAMCADAECRPLAQAAFQDANWKW